MPGNQRPRPAKSSGVELRFLLLVVGSLLGLKKMKCQTKVVGKRVITYAANLTLVVVVLVLVLRWIVGIRHNT